MTFLHLAGRNVLQTEEGSSTVSERDVSHCPYCVPLVTRSAIAHLLSIEAQGSSAHEQDFSLRIQKPQTISVCPSWGPGDTRLVVQGPGSRGGRPSPRGDGSGEHPGTAEAEHASAFGKGTSENKNILADCFSKCCKTINIYMEIWVLNNC